VTAAQPIGLIRARTDSWPSRGAVADVLALHPGKRGEHGEYDARRVVRSLDLAREELKAYAAGMQLLDERPGSSQVTASEAGDLRFTRGAAGSR
jgi:hypothetical protein